MERKRMIVDEDENRILYGTVKSLSDGHVEFAGEVEDVTKEAVMAVTEYMINEFENRKCKDFFELHFKCDKELYALKIERWNNEKQV